MPYRTNPIVTGEIYHVFNRSVANQPIFLGTRNYKRALAVLKFYRFAKPAIRFSHFNRLSNDDRDNFLINLSTKGIEQVEFFSYCLMPTHFHFLIRETTENGIAIFLSNFQNSYAKYFNVKNERNGSVFQLMFKAVRIEDENQLLHVTRYIHLNPLTAYIIKSVSALERYPWSSYSSYLGQQKDDFVNKKFILDYFPTLEDFKKFTLDQVGYQRELDKIKHMLLE